MKIGIDLGGTQLRAGLVDRGILITKERTACPSKGSEAEVLDALIHLIEQFFNQEIEGIGIGVPSVVDAEQGIVYNAANIPSWKEVHLKQMLQEKFHVPVAVNNDANCFAWGEARFGQGRGYRNMVGLTLGTGVGAGLVLDGRLYGGTNTGAGEVGALPYLDRDYESYCSSGFFLREYGRTGLDAARQALGGDPEAQACWQNFGGHLGQLMKAVLLCYDPDAVVLGGSISQSYDLYRDAMLQAMAADFPYPETLRRVRILPTANPDIALLGAAALE